MRKFVIAGALILVMVIASPVLAQNQQILESVRVEILPEYDQPKVLVIHRISLPSDSSLPIGIVFRVPAQAEIWAVATVNATDSVLVDAPYSRSIEGDWAVLTFNSNSLNFQVEYYEPLVKEGITRHIKYTWGGDYQVNAFSIAFQQPVGATDLVLNPILANGGVNQSGSIFYRSESISLQAGETFSLTADYQKTSDDLSTTGLPVQPSQPLDDTTPGRITMTGILPWILVGIGVILIAVAITYGFIYRKDGSTKVGRSRKRHTSIQKPILDKGETYCTQCGKRAYPGDVFCRTCGTRLPQDG